MIQDTGLSRELSMENVCVIGRLIDQIIYKKYICEKRNICENINTDIK